MGNEDRASRRRYVAGPIRWWLLALGLVLTLTAVTYGFAASVASSTDTQARQALDAAGLDQVLVDDVQYRDVALRGPSDVQDAATETVSSLELVHTVDYTVDESLAPTPSPEPTPTETAEPSPSPSESASPSPSATPSETETPAPPLPELPSVYFEAFSADLTTRARAELDGIADTILDALETNPGLTVQIDGYSDSLGTDEENQALTLERAENVRDYLAQADVPRSIMETTGHGEASPVASNSTESGRALNRRVEITLTEG